VFYSDCNVHLCVSCVKAFHTIPNLVDKKENLKELFDTERKAKLDKDNELKMKASGLNDLVIQELFDSSSSITML
jgi:hypothetical protein